MTKRRWFAAFYVAAIAVAGAIWLILRAAGEHGLRAVVLAGIYLLAVQMAFLTAFWVRVAMNVRGQERWFAGSRAVAKAAQGCAFAFWLLLGRWGFVALFGSAVVAETAVRRLWRRRLPEVVSDTEVSDTGHG